MPISNAAVKLRIIIFAFTVGALSAQTDREVPLALAVEATGAARFTPADSSLSLEARPGDIFFSGDTIRASGGKVRFISCRDKAIFEISGATEVRFETSRALRASAGGIDAISRGDDCSLPPLPRSIDPNLQHAGAGAQSDEPAGIGTAGFTKRIQDLPATFAAEFEPLSAAAKTAPGEVFRRLPLVRLLEKHGLALDAAAELRGIAGNWPDAAWVKSWIFDLEQAASAVRDVRPVTARQASGNSYALLVGISDFKNQAVPKLRFAHRDAEALCDMLHSPRGGGVPSENLVLLTNQRATTSAIRAAIESTIKTRAGPGDTILLFIASHGVVADSSGKSRGYVLTYDSDPEDLATTAIPMTDIRKLFEDEMTHGHRLLLFVDVCHAGRIGQIVTPESRTNRQAETMAQDEGQFFGLLAAQGNEYAIEGTQFGGGHGAFSQFLLEAWNGRADFNHDHRVTMDEFAQYVIDKVPESTAGKQIPKQLGDIDAQYAMAHEDREGISLLPFSSEVLLAKRAMVAPPQRTARQLRYEATDLLQKQFDDALDHGRLLPTEDQCAFTFLRALKLRLPGDEYLAQATRLRVALEEAGQNVLALYLKGEQVPQTRSSFLAGSAYFESAALLASDSLYLNSRALFCEGRTLIFDKKYPEAIRTLERSLRLDPERSYSYNALGIAYLERGDIPLATAAFNEAVRRSPYWVYPLHNLGLAQSEAGDYGAALRTYDKARRLAPKSFYLPYNKGLLLEKLHRRREAEESYRLAMSLDASKPQPYIAMGHLKASQGHFSEAERYYRLSLEKDAANVIARHDLAVLLAGRRGGFTEAEALWREALARDPDFLPARLSLARSLDRQQRTADSIRQFELVVKQKPEYVAARLALARLYAAANDGVKAVEQAHAAAQLAPESGAVYETLGDSESAAGEAHSAAASWQKAFALTGDRDTRKRLRKKIESIR